VPARARTKDIDFTGAWLQYSRHYFKQCTLPRAIRSDNRDALARMEMKRDLLQRYAPVVTDGQILHSENGLVELVVIVWIHAGY
jgi:hypothetical protein